MSRMFAEPLMSVAEGAVVFGMLIFVAATVVTCGSPCEMTNEQRGGSRTVRRRGRRRSYRVQAVRQGQFALVAIGGSVGEME